MNRFACIYIGAGAIEAVLAQRGSGNKIKILDRFSYPIHIAMKLHRDGYIPHRSSQTIQRVLTEYIRLARESLCQTIEIIISTDLRGADNFLFVYERLETAAQGCTVRVLTDEEEMELFCASAKIFLTAEQDTSKLNMMLAAIVGDSINFALTTDGLIDYTEQIPYGYFKLSDLIESITREHAHYSKLLSEIIENKLRLAVSHIDKRRLDLICLTTRNAQKLSTLVPHRAVGSLFIFPKESIEQAYQMLKELTPAQIKHLHPQLSDNEALTIQSTIIVARQLMTTGGVDQITLLEQDIAYARVKLHFHLTLQRAVLRWTEESAYTCAKAVAERYRADSTHLDAVEYYALRLFDTLRRVSPMGRGQRHLLRIAAQLLDVGQFGGEDGQAHANKEIIEREKIIGLSAAEQHMLARVCCEAKKNHECRLRWSGSDFSPKEALQTAQLTAILKLAATLDQSRRQKVARIQCSLSDTELVVKVATSHNMQLETYYFNRDRAWIERVFEVRPVLKVKRAKV